MNGWNVMIFGNLRFWKNARVPFFKFPQQNGFEKSQIQEKPAPLQLALTWPNQPLRLFDINNNLDLEQIVWTSSVSSNPWNFWPVMSQGVQKPCFWIKVMEADRAWSQTKLSSRCWSTICVFGHQGSIAARTAYWPIKENWQNIRSCLARLWTASTVICSAWKIIKNYP